MTDKAKASEHDLREGSKPQCPKCSSMNIHFYVPADNVHCFDCGADYEYEALTDFAQFFPIAAILEENQRLAKELERFKALEAHLPKGYAIGDDATAELAVEMGKMREELLKVAEDAGPFMQPYFEELRKAGERWK